MWSRFCNLTTLDLTRASADQVNCSAWISACLLRKLTWIRMDKVYGDANDFKLIKYILCEAEILKELYLTLSFFEILEDEATNKDVMYEEMKFCSEVFILEKRSLICEVQVCGDSIESSSKNFQNGSLFCRVV